jgi:acetyltransferase-like isoleucine patch superfamily enzyme/dTDP-4-dehydrorhamnose 3,5-epimerase-like enzyme
MASVFIHPQGICDSKRVGAGTRIWAFAHVLAGARIGRDCNICDHVFVENDVVIGDRTTVKCGVQLWDGVRLGHGVFVGPNATFTNDPAPRSKRRPPRFSETVVKDGASIGANATILPGVVIGENALVGAGTVVTRSVPSNAIVMGNPSRITGYVNSTRHPAPPAAAVATASRSERSAVRGVRLLRLPVFGDIRGTLAVGEGRDGLPFAPKRYFFVYNVPGSDVRGEHAHKKCHQLLICVQGHVKVAVDNGRAREEFVLNAPSLGLHVPPLVWATQFKHSADAVLLVLASHPYSAGDYIRDYSAYRKMVRAR